MSPYSILALALCLLCCGLGIFVPRILYSASSDLTFLTGLFVCLLVSFILFDIYRLKPSRSHTVRTLLFQYIVYRRFVEFVGNVIRRKFVSGSANCAQQQSDTLKSILHRNKGSLFSKEQGLSNLETVEEFRKNAPLTRYKDYEKYMTLVANEGTENVMFPGKADYIALTSGTTGGHSKAFSKSKQVRKISIIPYMLFTALLTEKCEIGYYYLKRPLILFPAGKRTKSKSGIEQGAVSYYLSFSDRDLTYLVPHCPALTEWKCMYIYLLFGLQEEDVMTLSMPTVVTGLAFFRTLEQKWERLCDDIEAGHLPEDISVDLLPEIRKEYSDRLTKNPVRARFLRNEFKKGFKLIVKRIWPEFRRVFAIRTGAFVMQARLLSENYTGDVPISSILHVGTETIYGLNFEPDKKEVQYTFLTPVCFFEFIPEEEMDTPEPTTLLAHQVKEGFTYEIVITTYDGLCRYRTEDIVKIAGFTGTVPKYEFVRRAGDIFSANLEKVPEFLLFEAVTVASEKWENKAIVEFTTVESAWVENITEKSSGASFYMVFIELGEGQSLCQNEMDMVDGELRARHEVYDTMRRNGKLNPIKLVQVHPGTFEKVKIAMLKANQNTFFLQFKLPRIMRRPDILKLLLSQRM